MYRPSGWSDDDLADYLDALTRPHDRQTVARVETIDRAFVAELPVLSGQVDASTADLIDRKCNPTILDEAGVFDGFSMDLQVRMVEQFRASAFSGEMPVFTGPVVRPPKRNEVEVSLELQDRSAISMRDRPTKSYPAGKTDDIMTKMLTDCGESPTYIAFGAAGADRTDEPTNIGGEDDLRPWAQVRALSDSLDEHVYYDLEGYARRRVYPTTASAIDLTGLVTGSGDAEPPSELVNRVKVTGKKVGRGNNARALSATKTLADVEAGHEFDPGNIKVGGVPQYFTATEDNSKLKTQGKVDARALRLMETYARKLVETRNYSTVPFGLLDLWDVVRVGPEVRTVTAYSFPLVGGSDMTLGYTRPLFVPSASRGRT